MDPRHPEQAVSRLRELMEQYDRIEQDSANARISSDLGRLEREGGLVVQEICLVAPRIHEAMMQVSRNRRHDLSHGVVEEAEKNVEEFKKYVSTAEIVDDEEPEEKPKKKTTRKKKTTKKADK